MLNTTHTHLSTKFMADASTVCQAQIDRYAKMVPSCQEVDGEIYVSPTDSVVVLMLVMKDMQWDYDYLAQQMDDLAEEVAVV